MSDVLSGLSDSDNTLLNTLISKEDQAKAALEAAKAACGTQFAGLAEKLTEVAKAHPDAVAEFLAQQPEFRAGHTSVDYIKDRGIDRAANSLQDMRTKQCIEGSGRGK